VCTEQFKIASEDSACSHILYAACHDTAYLSQLVPMSGVREKVTLVQAAGFNSDFHQFNLNITTFPTVFRWSDLPTTIPSAKTTHTNGSTPHNSKAAQKKPSSAAHSGLRQNDTWANGSISPRDSITEASTTNGLDTSSGTTFGSKATNTQKSSQQLCKYFQKVNHYNNALFVAIS
jgi:hypothetical protein